KEKYEKATASHSSLSAALNADYQKIVRENREYIKTIAETLLLTATQNIPQRGHNQTEGEIKGNFLSIMELLAKDDNQVKRKRIGQRNATYLGHSTQNEIIDCLAEMVPTSIISEVSQTDAFSILVDETKDISKKEQKSFVIRYYYEGEIHESFLTFEAAERLDAAALSQKVIQVLQKYGLDYKKHLVVQAYDGASEMSVKNTGVQARIKVEAPLAFYVHCNAHCLNLVLVDTVKSLPEAYCYLSLLQKVYVFVSGSYVHQMWLEVQKEMFPGAAPRELQRLIETRWECSYKSCKTVMERLPAIIQLLTEISEDRNGDRAVEARGLLAQIDLKFAGLLVSFTKIFGEGNTDKESFRKVSFIPVVYVLLSEVKRRFSKENCVIMEDIQALNPCSPTFCEKNTVFAFASQYNCNSEDLEYELPQLKQIPERKKTGAVYSEVFDTMFKLCKIALALPVSTASCEGSFSVLKLIKTHLRNTTSNERLSNLGVLGVESRRAGA
uniref:DUF4371 domain-containing protein n=1 Tax=Scophthalmus maximus TaxID=52904 RepID=A0A8D3D2X9_SCOMX